MAVSPGATLLKDGKRLCALHHCAVAVAFWEQAACLRPADPSLHYQLGFCHAGCDLSTSRNAEIALYHYRRALALEPAANGSARALLWAALGDTYRASPQPSRARLRTSLDCLQRAARLYDELGRREDWAREQFNLGNAWCEMPEEEFPGKWQQAIAHYERALTVRTRRRNPERYASTLQNLGSAWRELKTGDPALNARRALGCYCRALRALGSGASRRKRADLEHNLGNAYLTLATAAPGALRHLRRALRHLDRAWSVRAQLPSRFDRAATQFSRGQVYVQLALRGADAEANLPRACACFADAQQGFARCGREELAGIVRAYRERLSNACPPASVAA